MHAIIWGADIHHPWPLTLCFLVKGLKVPSSTALQYLFKKLAFTTLEVRLLFQLVTSEYLT